jgi:hypothetical protein
MRSRRRIHASRLWKNTGCIGKAEVVLPSWQVAPECLNHRWYASSSRPVSDLPDAFLHGCKGFGCNAQFDRAFLVEAAVAQEFAVFWPCHCALLLVDSEPESRIEPLERLHHVFTRALRPDVCVQVIRVADEGDSAFLKLLVHLVEEHVGHQRRKGTPLGGSLVPLHHHAVRHHAGVQVATDEPQHPLVADALRQPPHQHIVVDAIEEFL